MNRFFQTAYYTIYIYLYLAIFVGIASGSEMPLLAFLCLFFGLLIAMVPDIFDNQPGRKPLFVVLGFLVSLIGFLPIRIADGIQVQYFGYGIGLISGCLLYSLQRQQTSYYHFMEAFKRTVLIASILIVLVLLFLLPVFIDGQIITFGLEELKVLVDSIVPIIIMLLAVGVLHLRALRSLRGGIDRDAFRRRQLRDVLLFTMLVTIVYTFDPFSFLLAGAAWLYEKALLPILSLIAKAFPNHLPDWPNFWQYRKEHEVENINDFGTAEMAPPETVTPSAAVSEITETSGDFQYLFVVVLILIVVLVNFLLLRKKKSFKTSLGYPSETVEAIVEEEDTLKKPTLKKRILDPRIRIRYSYREFLKHLRKLRIPLEATDTTMEIENKTCSTFPNEAEALDALSRLYNRARYQQSEVPSTSDAENMRELVKKVMTR